MFKHLSIIVILVATAGVALAAKAKTGFLEGTVQKVDAAGKTVVVKVSDGTEHTFHFVARTAVIGAQDVAAGSKDAFHGVKEGSVVAVHYTSKGAVDTAEEVDNLGKDGLRSTEGAVTRIDRGAKTIAVKTANGTEETYRLTDSAAKDASKDVAQGTEKAAKVTVYYTEESEKKIAHFFKPSR